MKYEILSFKIRLSFIRFAGMAAKLNIMPLMILERYLLDSDLAKHFCSTHLDMMWFNQTSNQ